MLLRSTGAGSVATARGVCLQLVFGEKWRVFFNTRLGVLVLSVTVFLISFLLISLYSFSIFS